MIREMRSGAKVTHSPSASVSVQRGPLPEATEHPHPQTGTCSTQPHLSISGYLEDRFSPIISFWEEICTRGHLHPPSRVYDTPACQLEIPTTIEEKLGGGMSTRASHTLTQCRSRCPRAKDARPLFCQVSLTFPLSASSLLQPCLHICTPGSEKEKPRVQAFQTRILVKSSLSFLSCIFLFIGECRPQMFVEVSSRLPLCGSRDLNSGCQTG